VQPALLALYAFHLIWMLLCFRLRSWPNAHFVLFLATCGAVYGAQYINIYLAQHWRRVGFSQNYFDARGVWISVCYSAPLLVVGQEPLHSWTQQATAQLPVEDQANGFRDQDCEQSQPWPEDSACSNDKRTCR
jgi:hypothetical protein